LLTIMHNLFIDGVRKKRRMREAFEAANVAQGGLLQLPNQVHRIQLTELEAALSLLPPEQKSTLLLIALEDRTYEEAAVITGVPVGTVRSRLSRARQSLLAAIDGLGADDLRGGRVRSRSFPVDGAARPVPLQAHRKDSGHGGHRIRLRKAVAAA
jgi:DNA-directed RNA polymerase specialized sigma24 family protein